MRCLPIWFFNTIDIGKSANDHDEIITASLRSNDKIGKDVLIFSGTSDNEPGAELSFDKYLKFSGSVRCVCHTISLLSKEPFESIPFLSTCISRINDLAAFINNHGKIASSLSSLQCEK